MKTYVAQNKALSKHTSKYYSSYHAQRLCTFCPRQSIHISMSRLHQLLHAVKIIGDLTTQPSVWESTPGLYFQQLLSCFHTTSTWSDWEESGIYFKQRLLRCHPRAAYLHSAEQLKTCLPVSGLHSSRRGLTAVYISNLLRDVQKLLYRGEFSSNESTRQ